MGLEGLQNAVEKALPNSIAYVFTDASAKDFYKFDDVISNIQKKQVVVNFLLTGACEDGKTGPGYQVYENISRISNGQAFDMRRDGIKELILKSIDSLDPKFESLKSFDFDTAGESETPLDVDNTFKSLTVSVSGLDSTLLVTHSNGSIVKSDSEVKSDNVKFLTFTPTGKRYNIEASAKSAYSVRIGGISDLKFEFGFSNKIPEMLEETSIQPLTAQKQILSIFASMLSLLKCIFKAIIIPATKDAFPPFEIQLKRDRKRFFSSALFEIPKTMFKIQIYGYDTKGNIIDRIISSGIESTSGS